MGRRNGIQSFPGRFKEEDAIFKVSCRRCLEEFSCRKSGYSALICEVVRSIVVRAAILESEQRQFEKTKKQGKKKKRKKKKRKRRASRHSVTFSSRRLKPGLESIVQSKRGRVLRSKSSERIVLGSTSTNSPCIKYLAPLFLPFNSLVRERKTVADHPNWFVKEERH